MGVSAEDRERVRRFLDEAVTAIWAGSIEVFFEPQFEVMWSTEPAAWSFIHKGFYIEVVQRDGGAPWAQVDFQNVCDLGNPPGIVLRLYEAVRAPERTVKRPEERTDEQVAVIKAAWHRVPRPHTYEGRDALLQRLQAIQ